MKTIINPLKAAFLLSIVAVFASCNGQMENSIDSKYEKLTRSINGAVISENTKEKCCKSSGESYFSLQANPGQCTPLTSKDCLVNEVSWMYETYKRKSLQDDPTQQLFWSVKKPGNENCEDQCSKSTSGATCERSYALKIN